MAHQILSRDIQTGTEMAWHKLTNIVNVITRENSGICYGMETRPTFYRVPTGTTLYMIGTEADGVTPVLSPECPEHPVDEKGREIEGWEAPLPFVSERPEFVVNGGKQLVGLDNQIRIGGAVNDTYQEITNGVMFETIDAALANIPHKIVSAGTVEQRTKVFVSVEIVGAAIVNAAGRDTKSVLNFIWGHGGKMAVKTKTGLTVIVCANTLAMALRESGDFASVLKHTKNALGKLPNLAKTVAEHFGATARFQADCDKLANESCTSTQAREIFTGLLNMPANLSKWEPAKQSTRTANQVDTMIKLFLSDYYTHASSGGEDKWKQNVSSEFGSGATAKEDFYRLLSGTVSDHSRTREESKEGLAELVHVGRSVMAMG
jgi:hypothetical protein